MSPTTSSGHPQTEEAETKAGQDMESWLREPEDYEWGRKVTTAIRAIEVEASVLSASLRAEVVSLLQDLLFRAESAEKEETDEFSWPFIDETRDVLKRLQ